MESVEGKLVYTPTENYNGVDKSSYTISDGNGGEITKELTINIESVNDKPVATVITATGTNDQPLTIDVLSGASDLDGDELTITTATNGDHGTVEIVDGKLVYTPAENYNGTDKISYTISDGNGGEITKELTINIESVNDKPVATIITADGTEDQILTIDVLSGASDLDGDDLTITNATNGEHGTVSILDGKLVYTPTENYNGVDKISYTISDGNGGEITKELTINIESVNDKPVATVITATGTNDQPLTIDVLSGASDLDGDELTITTATNGDHGTVEIVDGKLVYTPAENYNGTDKISYTISDGNGGEITKELTINIESVNDKPVATIITADGTEDQILTIDVLSGASDLDGDDLTITNATNGEHGTVSILDGKLVYTPTENYNGVDKSSYTISDGNGGEITKELTINIESVNDKPVATVITATGTEDQTLTIDVLSGASDLDGDELTITTATNGDHGTVEIVDGKLVYTPAENYNGQDKISYTISDGNGGEITKELTINIESVNDKPVATIITADGTEDETLTIDVLAGASDADGDELIITGITQGEHGTVEIVDGKIVYTPTENYNGQDKISYTISDGKGGEITKELTINIESVNDKPVATIIK